jgi:hypothetical protein
MGIVSINEPTSSRTWMAFPNSINEPAVLPDMPVITSLEPATCAIGDPDFTLDVVGTGFSAESVIHFAGHDEPTVFNEPDTVSTGVKPSLWLEPVTVQCSVRNGPVESDPVDFVFRDAAGLFAAIDQRHPPLAAAADPDELEEEIEEAEDEGDFKPTHSHHGRKPLAPKHRKK